MTSKELAERLRQYANEDVADYDKVMRNDLLAAAAALEASAPLHVVCGRMEESNGQITWCVFLAKAKDANLFDCHQLYSDHTKGRAEYEAAKLKHFLGQGPEPDILKFDTDQPLPTPIEASAPEGYVLVPREPTDEMYESFMVGWQQLIDKRGTIEAREYWINGYRAMIAAAPAGERK